MIRTSVSNKNVAQVSNLVLNMKKFDAVEFQRKARLKISEKYNTNRDEFLSELKRKYNETPKHKTRNYVKKALKRAPH
jgi:hypothetical protein